MCKEQYGTDMTNGKITEQHVSGRTCQLFCREMMAYVKICLEYKKYVNITIGGEVKKVGVEKNSAGAAA